MLRELAVKDFALVDDLRIEFGPGLNVLTGETGAGKSILVDAIALAVGERASAESVRTGREKAVVEAVFEVESSGAVRRVAGEMGVDPADGLVIRREIARAGPNRCYLNGTSGTVAMLKRLGDLLVDIHGQHEHQSLLHRERHVDFLDGYLGLGDLRSAYAGAFRTWRAALASLERTRAALDELRERVDYLRFAHQEIERANLRPDEEEALEKERRVLAHSENLACEMARTLEALYESDGSALDLLGSARRSLHEASQFDPDLADLVQALERAIAEIGEVARSAQAYGESVEHRPERLEEINQRLALIERFKRRYRGSVRDILARDLEMAQELHTLDNAGTTLDDLEGQTAQARSRVLELGRELMARRRAGAPNLGAEAASVLADLEMKKARFVVASAAAADGDDGALLADAQEDGLERVEFLISPNVGEPPKPLAKIASGGEISRIMLALKTVLVRGDEIGTLVFDEIDIGIGGQAARTLAAKLSGLGRVRQVLCVTHLPQIAGLADAHYAVGKNIRSGRTRTEVRRLEGDARVLEIARMIAGARPTETAVEHARELMAPGGRAVRRRT